MQSYGAPYLEWQTGQYDRFARFSFILPYRFLLLCRLIEIPPQEMLEDFMASLGFEGAGPEGNTAQKHLLYYFLAKGYGQQYYTRREIHRIFAEMNAINVLFPNGDETRIEAHVIWRDDRQHRWFNDWFQKARRLPPQPPGPSPEAIVQPRYRALQQGALENSHLQEPSESQLNADG